MGRLQRGYIERPKSEDGINDEMRAMVGFGMRTAGLKVW